MTKHRRSPFVETWAWSSRSHQPHITQYSNNGDICDFNSFSWSWNYDISELSSKAAFCSYSWKGGRQGTSYDH